MATHSPGPCRHTRAVIGMAMTLVLVGTACSSSSSRGEAADPIPSSTSSGASTTDASAAADDPTSTEADEPTRVVGREQLDVNAVTDKPGVLVYRPGTGVDADLQQRERVSGPIAYMTFGEPDSGLVIVEPDGTEPRNYSDLKGGGVFPNPAWPGLVALRPEGELIEWLDVAAGTRVQRPDNTLSELSGGYEIASVIPPRESQSPGLSGPRGAFEMDEGWLPWSVEGSTVLAISVDVEQEIVIGAGAFAVSEDELNPVHLFETPEGVSIYDAWLDRTGRSIFAMLTDGSETWIETVAFDRPGASPARVRGILR